MNESALEEEQEPMKLLETDEYKILRVDAIVPDPSQPRKIFRDEDLRELAESICFQGMLQPMRVRPIGPDQYMLIAGERRWRACKIGDIISAPCIVDNRVFENPCTLGLASLGENCNRVNHEVLELYDKFQELMELGATVKDLEEATGYSQGHIYNILSLSKAHPQIMLRLRGDMGRKRKRYPPTAVFDIVRNDRDHEDQLRIWNAAMSRTGTIAIKRVKQLLEADGQKSEVRDRSPREELDKLRRVSGGFSVEVDRFLANDSLLERMVEVASNGEISDVVQDLRELRVFTTTLAAVLEKKLNASAS